MKRSINVDIYGTKNLAHQLARQVRAGDCIALSGEVGAGKTTFAQAFIESLLEIPETITSPTFTLIQNYVGKGGLPIMHADLYRLKSESELAELGLEEALQTHVSLIEWPEIAKAVLPQHTVFLTLEHIGQDSRKLTFYSIDTAWQERLRHMA
jgi:tRNA threonylcarbamoyl adenosine modification protein YjeE